MWQFDQYSLHILTEPKFMMLKTMLQVTVIILAKTVGKSEFIVHTVLYFLLFIAFLLSNVWIKAFNYRKLCGWHVVSLVCLLWLEILNVCDKLTSEHFAYVILLFVGWAFIIVIGKVAISRKNKTNLYFQNNPNLQ
jgi:hypothetical protein